MLGIACYNMGVELEHLKKYDDALKAYERGLELMKGRLADSHVVYQNLLNGAQNLQQKKALNAHGSRRIPYRARIQLKSKEKPITSKLVFDQLRARNMSKGHRRALSHVRASSIPPNSILYKTLVVNKLQPNKTQRRFASNVRTRTIRSNKQKVTWLNSV